MQKDLFNGILGLWLIILAFLGFPSSVQKVLVIISGLAIAFVSFWKWTSGTVARSVDKPKE
jgi:hypothetical protein